MLAGWRLEGIRMQILLMYSRPNENTMSIEQRNKRHIYVHFLIHVQKQSYGSALLRKRS